MKDVKKEEVGIFTFWSEFYVAYVNSHLGNNTSYNEKLIFQLHGLRPSLFGKTLSRQIKLNSLSFEKITKIRFDHNKLPRWIPLSPFPFPSRLSVCHTNFTHSNRYHLLDLQTVSFCTYGHEEKRRTKFSSNSILNQK